MRAAAPGRVHGSAVSPAPTATSMRRWYAGWYSTSSTRSPVGAWVRRSAVTRSAWSAQARPRRCRRGAPRASRAAAPRVGGRHPPLDGLREGRVGAQHVEAARGRDDVARRRGSAPPERTAVTVGPMTDAKRRLRRLLSQVPGLLRWPGSSSRRSGSACATASPGWPRRRASSPCSRCRRSILGLVGGLGYVADAIGPEAHAGRARRDQRLRRPASSPRTSSLDTLVPTVDDVLRTGASTCSRRVPALAVVGVARPQRLRRHDLDHVRPVRRARHRAHAGAVLLALPPRPAARHRHHPAGAPGPRACSARSSPSPGTP